MDKTMLEELIKSIELASTLACISAIQLSLEKNGIEHTLQRLHEIPLPEKMKKLAGGKENLIFDGMIEWVKSGAKTEEENAK